MSLKNISYKRASIENVEIILNIIVRCMKEVSNLIEIPSSKSSHGFYHKLGYEYYSNPPVFNEQDGSAIMYKCKSECIL